MHCLKREIIRESRASYDGHRDNMDTGDIGAYSAWIQDCWTGSDGVERGGFLSIPQKEGSQG